MLKGMLLLLLVLAPLSVRAQYYEPNPFAGAFAGTFSNPGATVIVEQPVIQPVQPLQLPQQRRCWRQGIYVVCQ